MDKYKIVPMNEVYAKLIIKWQYEDEYLLYNMHDDQDTMDELLNGSYYVLLFGKEIIGYYCYGFSALVPSGIIQNVYNDEGYLDFGLGKNPRFCGDGCGYEFVCLGLEFFKKLFNTTKFRLTVYDFNTRAIKVYEKVGFKTKYLFKLEPKSDNNFIVMLLN